MKNLIKTKLGKKIKLIFYIIVALIFTFESVSSSFALIQSKDPLAVYLQEQGNSFDKSKDSKTKIPDRRDYNSNNSQSKPDLNSFDKDNKKKPKKIETRPLELDPLNEFNMQRNNNESQNSGLKYRELEAPSIFSDNKKDNNKSENEKNNKKENSSKKDNSLEESLRSITDSFGSTADKTAKDNSDLKLENNFETNNKNRDSNSTTSDLNEFLGNEMNFFLRSLGRAAEDEWTVTPNKFKGINMNINSASVEETSEHLIWTVVVDQTKEGNIFNRGNYYHHVRIAKENNVPEVIEINNNKIKMEGFTKGEKSTYAKTTSWLEKGEYTYTITTGKPIGDTAVLPFKVFMTDKSNSPKEPNGSVETTFTATRKVQKNGNINVNITASSGVDISGIKLSATGTKSFDEVPYNASGSEFKEAPAGSYSIIVTGVPSGYKVSGDTNVTVNVGETAEVDLRLVPENTKTGNITVNLDSNGADLSGMKILATKLDSDGNATSDTTELTLTSGENSKQFSDLSTGKYKISFSNLPSGWTIEPVTAIANVVNGAITNLDFNLKKGGSTWTFVVSDKENENQKISDATIKVIDDNDETSTGTTNGDGKVTITGEFTNNKVYKVTSTKDGYVDFSNNKDFRYNADSNYISYIKMQKRSTENRNFNFIFKSQKDNSPINGVKFSITDDNDQQIESITNAQGKSVINGKFTPGNSYKMRIISVPNGYIMPSDSIPEAQFNESSTEVNSSTPWEVKLNKNDLKSGQVRFKTNIDDADVKINIYEGEGSDKKLIYENKVIPASNELILNDFKKNQKYTIEVVGDSKDKYSGGISKFFYNTAQPNVKVFLNDKPADNKYAIRIHEENTNGPLSNKLDGYKIIINKIKPSKSTIVGTIRNGIALLDGISGNNELIKAKLIRLEKPNGEVFNFYGTKTYIAIPNDEKMVFYSAPPYFTGNNNKNIFTVKKDYGSYQDWVIIKSTTDIYLNARPPIGKNFPENMKVTLKDSLSNVIKGPVPIGNGDLVFNDAPQGRTYYFKYDNVPEGWTHSNKTFDVSEDEVKTSVEDQFGYEDPNLNKSIVKIRVKNNQNEPVSGFVFQLKNSRNEIVGEFETGKGDNNPGEVYTILDSKFPPGEYTLINTSHPGYKKIKDYKVILNEDKPNIDFDTTVARSNSETGRLNITLLKPDNTPMASTWLEVYEQHEDGTEKLVTDQIQTDNEGKTYIDPIIVGDKGGYFVIRLKNPQDKKYQLIEANDSTKNILVKPNQNKNVVIRTKLNENVGQINISTKKEDGTVAKFVSYEILDNNGKVIKSGITNNMGESSEYVEFGKYKIRIKPSEVYQELSEDDRTKLINLNKESPEQSVEFENLKVKSVNVNSGGSISVEGKVLDQKTSWTVTVDKYSNQKAPGASGSKRGVINTIKFSAKELVNPRKLKLTVNGEEKAINGELVQDGEYYVLRDDHSDDLTNTEQKFVYTFLADAIDDPPVTNDVNQNGDLLNTKSKGYKVEAKVDIISNSNLENISSKTAALKLKKIDDNVNLEISNAYGIVDNSSSDANWSYDIKTNSSIDGKFRLVVSIPEGQPQIPFSEKNSGIILMKKNSDGSIDSNTNVEFLKKIEDGKWIIDIPIKDNKEHQYRLKVQNKVKKDKLPEGDYEQNLDLQFITDIGEGNNVYKQNTAIARATKSSLPIGNSVEKIVGCPANNMEYRVFLEGDISSDGKNIMWKAKIVNVNFESYNNRWPVDIHLSSGVGLGNIKNLVIDKSTKSFPFLMDDSFQDPNNDENNSLKKDITIGINDRIIDQYREHPLDDDFKFVPSKKYKDKRFPYAEPIGNDSNFERNDQRLHPGDYVVLNFQTEITDFSKVKDGYEISAQIDSYGSNSGSNYTKKPVCQSSKVSLNIKRSFEARGHSCDLLAKNEDYPPGNGEVFLQASYNETGTAIIWTVFTQGIDDKQLMLSEKREFNIDLQFLDKDNNEVSAEKMGLGKPQFVFRDKDTNDGGQYELTDISITKEDHYNGRYSIKVKDDKKNLGNSIKIITPINNDNKKEKYRLKISGKVKSGIGITSNILKNDNGGDYCIASIEGKVLSVRVMKKWTNLFKEQPILPELTMKIYQKDISGKIISETTRKISEDHFNDGLKNYKNYNYSEEGGISNARGDFSLGEFDRFDKDGNRYYYQVVEEESDDFKTSYTPLSRDGSLTLILNIRENNFVQEEDPTKYTQDERGKYPTKYRQDGPDVRNAYTHLDDTNLDSKNRPNGDNKGSPYHIEYKDSIISKSAQQTDIPGEFDMKLTIEGKGSSYKVGTDVVFVLDNSGTMQDSFEDSNTGTTKMSLLSKTMNDTIDSIYNSKDENGVLSDVNIGIVTFGTTVTPNYPVKYKDNSTENSFNVQKSQSSDYPYSAPVVYLKNREQKDKLKESLKLQSRPSYASASANQTNGNRWVNPLIGNQTNIQDGIRQGIKVLYNGNSGDNSPERNKILVILSDGAPSAHYLMKHKDNPSLDDELRTNTKYFLGGNLPYNATDINGNNILVDNNGIPTINEMKYWKNKHKDMKVFSLSMDPNAARGEGISLEEQEKFLQSLTTDPNNNFFYANSEKEFEQTMKKIVSSVRIDDKTIREGIVTDPMGEKIILKDINKDKKLTSSSTKDLEDGDYYLEDNQGNHLNKNDEIVDKKGNLNLTSIKIDIYQAESQSILSNKLTKNPIRVDLDTNGQPLKIKVGDETEYRYNYYDEGYEKGLYRYLLAVKTGYNRFRILTDLESAKRAIASNRKNIIAVKNIYGRSPKLLNDSLGYGKVPKQPAKGSLLEGVHVEKNNEGFQISGLNLGREEEVRIYYKINLNTDDSTYIGNNYYPANKETILVPRSQDDTSIKRFFPIPSVKGPHEPIKIQKKWVTKDRELTTEEKNNLSARFKLIRYSSKNSYVEGEKPQKDETTKKQLYEVFELNKDNDFSKEFNKLPAYDSEGKIYFYEFEEVNMTDGWNLKNVQYKIGNQEIEKDSYKYQYTKEKGSYFVSSSDQQNVEGALTFKFINTNTKPKLPDTGGIGFTPSSILFGLGLLVACYYIYKVNIGEEEYL